MPYPFPAPREQYDPLPSETEDEMNVSSASDCTGLIPAAHTGDCETDNYNELYDFLPRCIAKSEDDEEE